MSQHFPASARFSSGFLVAVGLTIASADCDEWAFFSQAAGPQRTIQTVSGRLIAESDESILIESPDQKIWQVQRADVQRYSPAIAGLTSYDRATLTRVLATEFPQSRILESPHYLIVYDGSVDTAKMARRLLEQVYDSYFDFCRDAALPVSEPDRPLIVQLFGKADAFQEKARQELGVESIQTIAYYGMPSNRVSINLTAAIAQQNRIAFASLSGGSDSRSVLATHLVHEATHQLMCNSGQQARFAPYPLWVSEGLAAYFETADRYAKNGWRRPGGKDSIRLATLRDWVRNPSEAQLENVLLSNDGFRQGQTAGEHYALAWGLVHYLVQRNRKEFAAYLRLLAETKPFAAETPSLRASELDSNLPFPRRELAERLTEYVTGL